MSKEKYSLVGVDGNIYAVIGYTTRAMRREGKSSEKRKAFSEDVMKFKDYDEALAKCIDMIDALNTEAESSDKELCYRVTNKVLGTSATIGICADVPTYVDIICKDDKETERCHEWCEDASLGDVFENNKVKVEIINQ